MSDEIKLMLQNLGIQTEGKPCVRCGKVMRSDYHGFCMDCADEIEISELFESTPEELRKKIADDLKKNEWFVNTGKAWGLPPFYANGNTTFSVGGGKV
ncbi:hypothetical protein MUP79_08645 [Candidatus Bathyarchaeota archaeon]|nr:hypothetical protein [Candidatus Bathyarchaeota archaeon]